MLAFINAQSGKVGTREIARAFGLKNTARAELKRVLRDLADEGKIERRRNKLHRPGILPTMTLADIVSRDRDGELIAVPAEWDEEEHGAAPKIRIASPRRLRPGEAAGIGDRVLVRTEPSGEADDDAAYRGRVVKILDRAKHRTLGIFRSLPAAAAASSPSTRRRLAANSRFRRAPRSMPPTANSFPPMSPNRAATASPSRA